jgi:hypothetical protein
MNLDVEDITQIRKAIKEETNELKSQLTREFALMVGPIKGTLDKHIAHDEIRDGLVNASLSTLAEKQTTMQGDVKLGRVVSACAWSLFLIIAAAVVSKM